MKKILSTITSVMFILSGNAQNIGIGTTSPAYKLDIAGRMRLQQVGTSTAGIWLDGTTMDARSFIGTINDDHVGIYGSGGTGWNFAMNVENGNTGIGTSAPTAKLDINGDIRIRGSFPKTGSVLSSIDVNGNARWADPIAFRAVGGLNGQPNTLDQRTWTKVFFNQTPNHNLGLNYQPFLSQFLVSENGIYHLDVSLRWEEWLYDGRVKILINRGGMINSVAENFTDRSWPPDLGPIMSRGSSVLSIDVNLFAGDLIWIEAFADIEESFGTTTTISANGAQTWFSGHLVARY